MRLIQSFNQIGIVGNNTPEAGEVWSPDFVQVSADSGLVYVATNSGTKGLLTVFRRDNSTGFLTRVDSHATKGKINDLLVNPDSAIHAAYTLYGDNALNGNKIDAFSFLTDGVRTGMSYGRMLSQNDIETRIETNSAFPVLTSIYQIASSEPGYDLRGRTGAVPAIADDAIYWIDGNNLNSYSLDANGLPGGSINRIKLGGVSDNFSFGEVRDIAIDPASDKLIFTSAPITIDPQPVYQTRYLRRKFVRTEYFLFWETKRTVTIVTEPYRSLEGLRENRRYLDPSTFVIDLDDSATSFGGTRTDSEFNFAAADFQFTGGNSVIASRNGRLVNLTLAGGNLTATTTSTPIGNQLAGIGNSTYFNRGGSLIVSQLGVETDFAPDSLDMPGTVLDDTAATQLHSVVTCGGGNVYAVDPTSNSLLRFRKATEFTDAPLVLVEEFVDGFVLGNRETFDTLLDNTVPRNAARVDGLKGASSIAVSDDGRWIYVASPGDGKIAIFQRGESATSRMRFIGTLTYNGAHTVQLTDDDFGQLYLLALGSTPDQFASWKRDENTGVISDRTPIVQHVDGLGTAADILGMVRFVPQLAPGLIVTETDDSTVVTEPDELDQFTVSLTVRPASNVIVKVGSDDLTAARPRVNEITISEEFTVDVATDELIVPGHTFKIGDIVTVSSTDTLPGGLSSSIDYVVDEVNGDRFKLCEIIDLGYEQTASITDAGVGIQTITGVIKDILVFTPENFSQPQTVFVDPVADAEMVAERNASILLDVVSSTSDPRYAGVRDSVPVRVLDDPGGRLLVTETDGTSVNESGGLDTLTVQLTRQPATDVFVHAVPDLASPMYDVVVRPVVSFDPDTDRVIASSHELISGDVVQFGVLPGGMLPAEIDPDQLYTVRNADPDSFQLQDPFDVGSGVVILSLSDAGQGTQFLTDEFSTDDILHFTPGNWDQPQTVVVQGVDNFADTPDRISSVVLAVDDMTSDDLFDGAMATVPVTVIDDVKTGMTFIVDTPLDVVDTDDQMTSLREAIIAANDNMGPDTIRFDSSLDGQPIVLEISGRLENDSMTGDLDVHDDVTIFGNGARNTIIDGGGIDRVFHSDAMNFFSIEGVTIRNGEARDGGMMGEAYGGAIFNLAGTLKINRSTLDGNRAIGQDGLADSEHGLGAEGGGLYANGDALVITNSTISRNRAEGGDGGPGDFETSIAVGNGGKALGGGIYTDGMTRIQNSTVSGNTAVGGNHGDDGFGYYGYGGDANGGGIYSNGGTIDLAAATITENTASEGFSGVFTSSGAMSAGGGIFNYMDSTLESTSTLIGNNSADSGPDAYGTFESADHTLLENISDTTFVTDGGGNITGFDPEIRPLGNYGGPTDTHALLMTSLAVNKGANTFTATDQRGFVRVFNAGPDIGAFEGVDASFVVDTAMDVINAGDGLTSLREAVLAANQNPGDDSIFFDPSLDGTPITLSIAGRLEDAAATGDLDITDNVYIQGNGAGRTIIDGGGLDRVFHVTNMSSAYFDDLTVQGGEATDAGTDTGLDEARGGAVLTEGGPLSIQYSVITGNTARGLDPGNKASGGAISVLSSGLGESSSTYLYVAYTTIANNQALAADGADGVGDGQDGTPGGSAYGGAINANPDTVVSIQHSTISGNRAVGGKGGDGAAGGLVTNYNGGQGGDGGAAFGGGIEAASLVLVNSTVSGNQAFGGDGGRGGDTNYGTSGNGGNSETARGGGLYGSQIFLYNSTITANVATAGMGGRYGDVVGTDDDSGVQGSVGIDVDSDGGGVESDSITSVSTIIAGNTAQFGPDVFGTFLSASHTLLQDNGDASGITADATNGNLIGVDPLLGPLADNGGPTLTHAFRPGTPPSPAIDAGSNPIPVSADQRGAPRVFGAAADIGAYEQFPPPPIVPELIVFIAGEEHVVRFSSLNDQPGMKTDEIAVQQPKDLEKALYDEDITRKDADGGHQTLFVASDTVIYTLQYTESNLGNGFAQTGKIESIPGMAVLSDIELIADDRYLVAASGDDQSIAVFQRNPALAGGVEFAQRLVQPSNDVNGIRIPTSVSELDRINELGRLTSQAIVASALPDVPKIHGALAPFNVNIDGLYDGIRRKLPDNGKFDAPIRVQGVLGKLDAVDVKVSVRHARPADLTYQLVYNPGANETVFELTDLNGKSGEIQQTLTGLSVDEPNALWALRVTDGVQNVSGELIDWVLNVRTDIKASGPLSPEGTSTIPVDAKVPTSPRPIADLNVTINADNINLATTTITLSKDGVEVNLWTPDAYAGSESFERDVDFSNLTFDEAFFISFFPPINPNMVPGSSTDTLRPEAAGAQTISGITAPIVFSAEGLDGLLRAFNGQMSEGVWELKIESSSGPVSLNSWSLTITEQVPDGYAAGFENQLAATVNSGGIQANVDPAGPDNTIRYISNDANARVQYVVPATNPTAVNATVQQNGQFFDVIVNLRTGTDGKLSTATEVADAVNAATLPAGLQLVARVVGKGDGPVAALSDFVDLVMLGGEDTVTIVTPNVPTFTLNTLGGPDTVTNIKQGGTVLTVNLGAGEDKLDSLQGSTSDLVIDAGPDNDQIAIYSVGGAPGFTDVFGRGGDDTFIVHLDRIADDGDNAAGEIDLRIDGGEGGETNGDKLNYWKPANLNFATPLAGATAPDNVPQFEIPDGVSIDRIQVDASPTVGTLDYSNIEQGMAVMPTQVVMTQPAPIFEGSDVTIGITMPTTASSFSFDLNADGNFGDSFADLPTGTVTPPTEFTLTAAELQSYGIGDGHAPELIPNATFAGNILSSNSRSFTMMDKGKSVVVVDDTGAETITSIAEVIPPVAPAINGTARLAEVPANPFTAYLPTSFPITVQLTSGTPQDPIYDYDTVLLVVLNAPPTLVPELTAPQVDGTVLPPFKPAAGPSAVIDVTAAKGQPVTLTLDATDMVTTDGIAQWTVDWGDASGASAMEAFNTQSTTLSHLFVAPTYSYSGSRVPTIDPAELGTQGDSGATKLTDNTQGGVDQNDGSWVKLTGADGATSVINFNFGRVVAQNTLRINYLADGTGINAPTAVTVEISSDNQTFTTVPNTEAFAGTAGSNDAIINLAGQRAQYVRLTFTPTAGSDIFLGEITFNPLVQITAQDSDATKFFSDQANDRLLFARHGFTDGQEIKVRGSSLPGGLNPNTPYFIVNKTDNDFQVSLTPGGAAVALTADGTGTLLQSQRYSVRLDDVAPTVRQYGGIAKDETDANIFRSPFHGLSNNDTVHVVMADGTANDRFVVNVGVMGDTFQLAQTQGGTDLIPLTEIGTLALAGLQINEGDTLALPLKASGPAFPAGIAQPASWMINWGDGTDIQIVTGPPALSIANHVYPDDGIYEVAVVAMETDAAGGVIIPADPAASAAGPDGVFTITVLNVAPELAVSGIPATPIDEGSDVRLVLNHSDVGDDTLVNWNIDWGDGMVQNVRVTRTTFTTPSEATTTSNFTSAMHALATGDAVQVDSTGSLPTGLEASKTYFVQRLSADQFRLSETSGGTPVTVTLQDGSGNPTFDGTLTFTLADFRHTYRDGDATHQILIAATDEDGTFVIDYAGTAFTADAATSVFTSAGHGLSDNDLVQVTATVTLPSALSEETPYYVVGATTDTFQLSTTMGGTPIQLSTEAADAGSGDFAFVRTGFVVVKNVAPTITLTGDIRRPVHFDLVSDVNSDRILNRRANSEDTSQDGPEPYLLTATAARTAGAALPGLPDDGLIPANTGSVPFDVQLNYNNSLDRDNAILLTGNEQVIIELRAPEQSNYQSLLLLAAGSAGDGVEVLLRYADGTTSTPPDVAIPSLTSTQTDNVLISGLATSSGDAGSIFALRVSVDPMKVLKTIELTGNNNSGSATIFGITGEPSTTILNEGERYFRLVTTTEDPGLDRLTDWVINWGDGTIDTINAPSGKLPTLVHVYADNKPANAAYTIEVTLATKTTGSSRASHRCRQPTRPASWM